MFFLPVDYPTNVHFAFQVYFKSFFLEAIHFLKPVA